MKKRIRYYLGDLFLPRRFYLLAAGLSLVFLLRFFVAALGMLPFFLLLAAAVAVGTDYVLLFFSRGGITGERDCPGRLSNGDENSVILSFTNRYGFPIRVGVIDELPEPFQKRDFYVARRLAARTTEAISYTLRPVKRGVYRFGCLRAYASTLTGLVERRFNLAGEEEVKVYPSYLQLRKYQLMAEANRWSEAGVRQRRRLGHSMEFEQIKAYVPGDDYRTLNWKATARSGAWMVNHYVEEKSQQVYCVIDKGRAMKMPFAGLSLLDYAINASLVLSHIALRNQDQAGLITFSRRPDAFVPAAKKTVQMQLILEALYGQKTGYPESDFESLYITIRKHIPQRSLLVLFTNFETVSALRRQEAYLRKLAVRHLLLVIIFENTGIQELLSTSPADPRAVYTQIVAEQFAYEKRLIIRELHHWGIAAMLSTPAGVTVDALNKYIELKARHAL